MKNNVKKDLKSTTDVRANFQDVIDNVHYTKTPLIITKRNKPWAIIYSLPEDGSLDTIEKVMANNKKFADNQFNRSSKNKK
jgi:prevent-host-death family protein